MERRAVAPPPTRTDAPKHKLHILLAEDNAVNQMVAVHTLSKEGHTVVVAENGLQVLQRLQTETFDVVLMDVQMPEMDGFEAAVAIRKQEEGGGRAPSDHRPDSPRHEGRSRTLSGRGHGCVRQQADPHRGVAQDAARGAVGNRRGAPTERDAVFDEAAALAAVDGNRDFLCRLAERFLEDSPQWLIEMEAGLTERTAARIDRAAHSLKGATYCFAAATVTAVAECLEQTAAAGNLAACSAAYPTVVREVDRLRKSLALLALPDGCATSVAP